MLAPTFDYTPEALAGIAGDDAARALAEDLGAGDLTAGLVNASRRARARVLAREPAIVCGAPWVEAVMRQVEPRAQVHWMVREGLRCMADQVVLEIEGSARGLLSAERTLLNFLQMMSAVATKTAAYVEAVQGTRAKIVDTRKTLPGLRMAQKYAVRAGGGVNHRIGLFDAILIKENHIATAGGVAAVLKTAQQYSAKAAFIQIEVETLAQLEEALAAGAGMILLDNMDMATLKQAVRINNARAVLEISGGVTLESVRALAETGVDRISIGALTKDVKATDYSMRMKEM